ncbi:MAG: ExbD/TolR family protein [Terriglobales bacterium]
MSWHAKEQSMTSDINVTPLCDVMLVLLIIFMVITPMMQHGVDVHLAQAQNPLTLPNADKDNAVIVAISHDGRIFLGNNEIGAADLTTQVQSDLKNQLDKIVFVKADRAAQFVVVANVVDDIRSAGVQKIALETTKVDKASLPPSLLAQ